MNHAVLFEEAKIAFHKLVPHCPSCGIKDLHNCPGALVQVNGRRYQLCAKQHPDTDDAEKWVIWWTAQVITNDYSGMTDSFASGTSARDALSKAIKANKEYETEQHQEWVSAQNF